LLRALPPAPPSPTAMTRSTAAGRAGDKVPSLSRCPSPASSPAVAAALIGSTAAGRARTRTTVRFSAYSSPSTRIIASPSALVDGGLLVYRAVVTGDECPANACAAAGVLALPPFSCFVIVRSRWPRSRFRGACSGPSCGGSDPKTRPTSTGTGMMASRPHKRKSPDWIFWTDTLKDCRSLLKGADGRALGHDLPFENACGGWRELLHRQTEGRIPWKGRGE